MSLKTYENIQKLPHIGGLILVAFVFAALHLINDGNDSINQQCDLFSGRWVYDDIACPPYKEEQCSFMEYDFACETYGRQDLKYQNWRWQPHHHCDLPRFNGAALLEKIKGKKLIFVGDSLIRNQWRSMLCLIESYLPLSSNKSLGYNATIGFYWSPMLVESNGDDTKAHAASSGVTVRVESIEEHGRHWVDADILVFDSFAWWMGRQLTILWGSFGSPNATQKRVERSLRPLEIALSTWSDWLEMNINRTKTKLFFMSLSPFHFKYAYKIFFNDVSCSGESWDVEQNCYNQTEPILKEDYWGIATSRDVMGIVESTIQKLEERGVKVEYLNITHLSDYRKDAHPSIYREFPHTISAKQLANPKSYSDCMHWCLPGLPDVWNQILYSYIINSS
ncbi:protein trichome birefringence-like 34 [Phtheirospermum japonicum]|uniref:Protein trichome birefringence-like 34 n=1 Tax=Phtheirospermum japonicum TaxID=374723 RepID=A0A830CC44_9LAMI|nr:protein trichome birefringence-like 34 [Phtheirospermum japonicum]